MKSGKWNPTSGTTAIFEMGMNPGLISHCVKKGLEDAGNFYLRDPKATDLDKKALEKWLADKNHSKIA
jgi:homospermidine synthase